MSQFPSRLSPTLPIPSSPPTLSPCYCTPLPPHPPYLSPSLLYLGRVWPATTISSTPTPPDVALPPDISPVSFERISMEKAIGKHHYQDIFITKIGLKRRPSYPLLVATANQYHDWCQRDGQRCEIIHLLFT